MSNIAIASSNTKQMKTREGIWFDLKREKSFNMILFKNKFLMHN